MTRRVVIVGDETLVIPDQLPALAGAEVRVVRALGAAEAPALLAAAEAVIVTPQAFPADFLDAIPRARIVTFVATGFDGLDLEAAARRGIWVTHVPGYCTEEVATHTVTLLLALNQRLLAQQALTARGIWDVASARPIHRLRGRTLGLLGFGRIGQAVTERARGFGLAVIAHDALVPADRIAAGGARAVDFETLLAEADYLSLHTPLTGQTRQIINSQTLARLRAGAVLINTARGALVDEPALLAALEAGRLAGAALDVLAEEPPPPDHPLLHHPRVLVTPHSAWCSEAAEQELWDRASAEVARVLDGAPPRWAANRPLPQGAPSTGKEDRQPTA
ncbi:MAG: C-terminal binding protein [Anaerolineales bacterium]|nr:C-terminal binding protein [Anaerolineales bacterium]